MFIRLLYFVARDWFYLHAHISGRIMRDPDQLGKLNPVVPLFLNPVNWGTVNHTNAQSLIQMWRFISTLSLQINVLFYDLCKLSSHPLTIQLRSARLSNKTREWIQQCSGFPFYLFHTDARTHAQGPEGLAEWTGWNKVTPQTQCTPFKGTVIGLETCTAVLPQNVGCFTHMAPGHDFSIMNNLLRSYNLHNLSIKDANNF